MKAHTKSAVRTRHVLLATGVLAVGIAPFGVAATGSNLREGVRNGTTTNETEIVGNIAATTANKGGYVTRQSNLSASGGGAIYGCRAAASVANQVATKPCIRANNLSTGLAFEFNANGGEQAGTITVGAGGESKRPFTTNATGVATGLNADRVDGQSASEIVTAAQQGTKTRWFLLNEKGEIEEQSGGFTVLDAYVTNQNVYVDTGSSLAGKGLTASIAIQNKIDQTADGTADPNFGGEVSIARCQTAAVECAPASSKTVNALVVSPRDSDGTATEAGARKRVYVVVTE